MIFDSNKIKNLIPYIGTLLIISGYIKLSIYYKHFNIKISDYLEITEIITLFLEDSIIYSGIIFFAFLFNFFSNSEDVVANSESYRNLFLKNESALKRLKIFLKFNTFLTLNLIIYSLLLLISYFLNSKNLYLIKVAAFATFSMLTINYLTNEFNRKYKITYGFELNATYLNLILIVNLFMIYVISSSFLKIREAKVEEKIISFVYLEKEIKSSKDNLYLGMTKNYLLMFDNKNKTSIIYSRQIINELHIKIR